MFYPRNYLINFYVGKQLRFVRTNCKLIAPYFHSRMIKILFLAAAAFIIYTTWIRPGSRLSEPEVTNQETDSEEFTPFEEITDD